MYVKQGSIVPVALQLIDGATGLFPSAVLCDGAGATVSGGPLSLTHAANGLYVNNAFAMPNTATVHVQYRVYSDSARTIPYLGYEIAVDTFLLDTTPTATANAAAVRTNLATELARMDVAVSTRLATAGYTAPLNTPTLAQIEASTVLAKEATVASRASQASVTAIPTNPLLTTDPRLGNLDAAVSTRSTLTAPQVRTELATELARMDVAVSTRLATAGYTAPLNTPTLAQIEASTVLAKEATVASRASQASVTAIPTNPLLTTDPRLGNLDAAVSTRSTLTAPQVRTELATELARMDVAVSTRLATAGYTAPLNTPTLAQIEASTVLAKEATVASRASQASVTELGTPAQAAALVALYSANQIEHDATQAAIAALPVPLDSTQVQSAAAAALLAYDAVVPADLAGLATSANVTSAQVAIIAEVDAIPTNPLLASNYVAPANADIAAIKTKTDALTFTVTGHVDANIQYVNDGPITGTGTELDPWGPDV